MITLIILFSILAIIVILGLTVGLGFMIAFGDVIICVLILYWLIKRIIRRRKKK